METCSVDGCDRTHWAKTLCQMHYRRKRKTGSVGPAHPIIIEPTGVGSCAIQGCERPYYAKGFCGTHYAQNRRAKQARKERAEYSDRVGTCEAEDCDNWFQLRSIGSRRRFCSRQCRDRTKKAKDRLQPDYLPPHRRPGRRPCAVEGCDKPYYYMGYCPMHAERVKKHGDPGEVAPRKAKRGEGVWRITRDGYLRRNRNGVPELQHRVVMEQSLGRPLWGDENVHHLNGDRSDNRIENLELWSKWQPGGQRVADKIAWAREILARYADLPREVL